MSSPKRKRDVPVLFWVSADEMELIQQKMAQFGTKNLSAYLRKMAVDGYVVQLDLPELKELVSLLRRSSNNLNQLTRKVHETGRIYDVDLEDISQRQEQLWDGVKEILTQLSKLRRTFLRFFFLPVSLPLGCETGIMESGTGTVILGGGITMRALVFLLKLLLKIVMVPVILALTLFVWICVGIVYVSGLVLGLISMVIALLGVAVLLTCSLQNGIILLVMAFLISPYGLPMAAIWLLGKIQDLKFAIQDLVYG